MYRRMLAFAVALVSVVALALMLYPSVFAQGRQGGGQGGGRGGGKPGGDGETTTGSNLSYPANFFGRSLQTGPIGLYSLNGTLGNGVSYGCAIPETIGTTTYPNTSCVTTTGSYQDAATCGGEGGKCYLQKVEPIYWQKNGSTTWQAGYLTSTTALPAEYIDWGDNLESRTWPVGAVRVEINTFSTLPAPDLTDPQIKTPRLRYDMWHVVGQGTTEMWGVHANDATSPVPYAYLDKTEAGTAYADWPYAVNVAGTNTAHLNLAKLGEGTAACPTVPNSDPYADQLLWSVDTNGTGSWVGAADTYDIATGDPELNIKGSYVYGYNWTVPSTTKDGATGPGWWRLTFYTTDGTTSTPSINFGAWNEPTSANNTLAPPVSPLTPSPVPVPAAAPSEGETSTALYVPIVDKTNNLTYIDICIKEGKGGGGGGKGRGRQ